METNSTMDEMLVRCPWCSEYIEIIPMFKSTLSLRNKKSCKFKYECKKCNNEYIVQFKIVEEKKK